MPAVGLGGRKVRIVERTGFDSRSEFGRFGRCHGFRIKNVKNLEVDVTIILCNAGASVRSRGFSRLRCERTVAFRPAIAEELPYFTDFCDHVEIEVRYYHFVFIPASLGDDFAARIADCLLYTSRCV